MKTITFYSYKGGVGRSLALSNIAVRLSQIGKKICVIDFDLEAPGLHHKFSEYFDKDDIKKGIVDYIFSYVQEGIIPKSIVDYSVNCKINDESENFIQFIPAGNVFGKNYWSKLSRIDWHKLFYRKESRGVEFFLHLKNQISSQLKPDILLIDSRTGITDISSSTLSILGDDLVLIGSNNRENKEGLKLILNSILRRNINLYSKKTKINLVLSRIPFPTKPLEHAIENEIKSNFLEEINSSLKDIAGFVKFKKLSILHSDRNIELQETLKLESLDFGATSKVEKSNLGAEYFSLLKEIASDILEPAELTKFYKFQKAESLLNKAKGAIDSYERENILLQVIKLGHKLLEAYCLLGTNFLDGRKFELAKDSFEKALQIDDDNIKALLGLAKVFKKINKINKSIKTYEKVLNIQPENYDALISLGNIEAKKGNNSKAIFLYKKIIEYYPNLEHGYNNYADSLRKEERYDEALKWVYKGLEINPTDGYSHATLAEINADRNQFEEFYKNLELAIALGFPLEEFLDVEDVYKRMKNDRRFINILEKYNIAAK